MGPRLISRGKRKFDGGLIPLKISASMGAAADQPRKRRCDVGGDGTNLSFNGAAADQPRKT